MANKGALVFTVGADTRPLARNLKKARGMLTGFGAGVGRMGAGLAKVGLGAAGVLAVGVVAARAAFGALVKLAPYSEDLTRVMAGLFNTGEMVKAKLADALVPAVSKLAQALNDAAPAIADAAVTMLEAAGAYLLKAQELSKPKPGILSGATAAYSEVISRLMGDDKTADQTIREQFPEWMLNIVRAQGGGNYGNTVYEPGEAGTDQLGSRGRGLDYQQRVLEALEGIQNNTGNSQGF